MTNMTTVVIGGGAIGLLVAGQLAQSAQRVAVIARPHLVETLQTRKVHIAQAGRMTVVDGLIAVADPHELPPDYRSPQCAILCVKGYDTHNALATLAALQPELILTLQNGIGHEETLAQQSGADRVLAGVITSSVEVVSPGQIVVTKVGGIGLARVGGAINPSAVAAMLDRAGFMVRTYADYRALKWSKALLNILGNATAAILDLPVAAVYADRRLMALERAAWIEVLRVMRHMHMRPLNLPGYPVAYVAPVVRLLPTWLLYPLLQRTVARGRGGKPPSLHSDLLAGRTQSEGAYLYGAIAQTAQELGCAAPVNTALWHVLEGIVTGATAWDAFRQQPERLLKVVAEQRQKHGGSILTRRAL